jgi:transcriptional regulator with XRE-family HTH domain
MSRPTETGRRAAGRVVEARRGELGLTQIEVASKAGVDMKTLRSLETGERWPIAKNLWVISAVLGLDPLYLREVADELAVA